MYVDSSMTGSYIENTHDWWCAAGRCGPGFGLFTVQWALIVLRLCMDTETGGFSLKRTEKTKGDCWRNCGHLCTHEMTNSCWETSPGDGNSHRNYCGLLSWLCDDPVRISGFLMNKDSAYCPSLQRMFQVSSPVLWMVWWKVTLIDKHLRPLSLCIKLMWITGNNGCHSCGSPLSLISCVCACICFLL